MVCCPIYEFGRDQSTEVCTLETSAQSFAPQVACAKPHWSVCRGRRIARTHTYYNGFLPPSECSSRNCARDARHTHFFLTTLPWRVAIWECARHPSHSNTLERQRLGLMKPLRVLGRQCVANGTQRSTRRAARKRECSAEVSTRLEDCGCI